MITHTGLMAYIAVFIFTFFVGSFLVARCDRQSPMNPTDFLLLVGLSLVWPLTLPLSGIVFLLYAIARLAEILAGR